MSDVSVSKKRAKEDSRFLRLEGSVALHWREQVHGEAIAAQSWMH